MVSPKRNYLEVDQTDQGGTDALIEATGRDPRSNEDRSGRTISRSFRMIGTIWKRSRRAPAPPGLGARRPRRTS
jgi:hypothetical protein